MKDYSVRHTTRAPRKFRPLPLLSRPLLLAGAAGALMSVAGAAAQAQPAVAEQQKPASQPAADVDALQRAQIAIDKPLMNLKQDAEHERNLRFKLKELRQGVLDNESRALIEEWVTWRLYRMTITEVPPPEVRKPVPPPRAPAGAPAGPAGPAGPVMPAAARPQPKPLDPMPLRRQLADFNKKFLQEIKGAASLQNNAAAAEAYRKYVLDRIIVRSRDLFDNNFYVRLNVAVLLSQLNIVEPNPNRAGGVVYAGISAPLLELIRDEDQHEATKIISVGGLKRVLTQSRADRDLKNTIALELMSQLEKKASHYWYPMRLIDAIGCIDEPLITRVAPGNAVPQQQPFHVHALMVAMRDQNRTWIERAEASKALGRVSMHATVSSTMVAHEIVVMCSQMSAAYNKDPNQFYWNQCFVNVYLTFKPIDEVERARVAQVKPATLIAKFDNQKGVSDAYAQVLPAILHILKQPEVVGNQRINRPIPDEALQATTVWINDNKPSIDRIAPGLPRLEAAEPMAAKVDAAIQPAILVRD